MIHYPTPPKKSEDRVGITNCKHCGKAFDYLLKNYKDGKTAQFCSKVCQGHSLVSRPKMRQTFRQIEMSCSQCGETFFRAQSQLKRSKHGNYYCSPACKVEAQKTKSPKVNEMKYGTIRRELLKLFDGSCQECGYSKRPDLLRIWYNNQNCEIIRPDNVKILCPNCFTEHQLPVQVLQRNRPLTHECRGVKGIKTLLKSKKK